MKRTGNKTTKEEKEIAAWKSVLIGAILGVPVAMGGALFALIFHLAESQIYIFFSVIPTGGLIGGIIVGFIARKPSKKTSRTIIAKKIGERIAHPCYRILSDLYSDGDLAR